jgi:hypothetical protein
VGGREGGREGGWVERGGVRGEEEAWIRSQVGEMMKRKGMTDRARKAGLFALNIKKGMGRGWRRVEAEYAPEASTAAPSNPHHLSSLLSLQRQQNACLPACQRRFPWPQLNVDGAEGGVEDDLALGRGLQVVDVRHGWPAYVVVVCV